MYIGGVGTTGKFPVALYTTHASEIHILPLSELMLHGRTLQTRRSCTPQPQLTWKSQFLADESSLWRSSHAEVRYTLQSWSKHTPISSPYIYANSPTNILSLCTVEDAQNECHTCAYSVLMSFDSRH